MSAQNTSSSMPWLTGEIFAGHFEVGSLIARGGMAEVYHGVDLWSNNPVAIKVLFPHLSSDPSQQQKFFREERSLRQVSHEHVVGVVGSGTVEVRGYQMMFIVLEYVHGCTLQQLLTVRPVLSVGEALQVLLPAVEGLSEVHAHRLIHRDMKPSNVLLSSVERSVKLTDFGLTRRSDQSWTGELMGTPAYVAPEIMTPNAQVGAGADIFALGIMMFRMLTGRLPFPGMGDDQQVIYHNVNTEIPSVQQFAPGVSNDIAGIIKWCTRKQAAARPSDATELFEVLSEVAAGLSDDELAYRADVSSFPQDSLWEAVESIAERSGATRVLGQTSISGFGVADDVLHEADDYVDEVEPARMYSPTPISGVGPEPSPQEPSPEMRQQTRKVNQEGSWNGLVDETVIDERPVSYAPISAHYRPKPSASRGLYEDDATAADSGVAGSARPGNPRRPAQPWRPAPSPVAMILTGILLLLGLVVAGFIGWQLATSVLTSAWFETWQGWLG